MAASAATEQMLRDWGLWIRMGKPSPGGAKSWLGVMVDRLVQQSRGPGLMFSESRIDEFDQRVMLAIKLNRRRVYDALKWYYEHESETVEGLAKFMGIRKQTACDLLNLGRDIVEGLTAGTS